MNRNKLLALVLVATVGLAAILGSIAIADPAQSAKTAGEPAFKLPPGWTEADMKACMLAGTPGKMHEYLTKSVGTWEGKDTMWMSLGAEPMNSDSTTTITSMMDGRFTKCEVAGDMPGMGPYRGL